MASDNRLDRLFRQKLEERSLPFDPALWLAAEELILAQERRKRRRRLAWWFFSCAALLLLASFGLWFLPARSGPLPERASGRIAPRTAPAAPRAREERPPMPYPKASLQKEKRSARRPETYKKATAARAWASSKTEDSSLYQKERKPSRSGSALETGSPNREETAEIPAPTKISPPATADVKPPVMATVDKIPSASSTLAWRGPGQAIAPASASFRPYLAQEVQLGAAWQGTGEPLPGFAGGVGLNLYVHPQWGIAFGVSYARLPGGNDTTVRESTAVEFGFGRSETTYSLQPRTLHFLESPVLLFFQKNRHRAELGGSVGYLIGARGELQAFNTGALDSVATEQTLSSGWLETRGLASWQAHLTAGYRYRLGPHLSLGARLQYRLSRFLQTKEEPSDRWRAQIMLTYHLVGQ